MGWSLGSGDVVQPWGVPGAPQGFLCEMSIIAKTICVAAESILTDTENGLAISIYEF